MKFSNTFFAAIAVIVATTISACNSSKTENSDASIEEISAISVDSLLSTPDVFVGDTIIIEGTCSHLCKHGGRKAFIMSSDSAQVLRCEATSAIGGAFAPDCVGHKLIISGVVCEERISEKEIQEMEARHTQTEGASDHACATEAKAQGQGAISEFEARMADYRERINKRITDEGKDYLSFYYLEATSYGIEE